VRVLVVGSAGQDGRILWDQLQENGNELIGITRKEVQIGRDTSLPPVDISDERAVRLLIDKFAPERIYFLAAHHHSSEDRANRNGEIWQASWRVHVEACRNFLEAIRISGLATRIFYASSSRIFGNPDSSPQSEATPIKPSCLYGITKATGMMLARHYRETHGVWASCGILYNHESPLRGNQFLSQRVARGLVAVKEGRETKLEIGSLDARVDWGYAPDYTRAMQLILEAPVPDDFVVATGKSHTVREMVEVAADFLGIKWQSSVVENSAVLQRPSLSLCGDSSRLNAATGWTATHSFHDLVRLMVHAALETSSSASLKRCPV
jgi:GDPmannose 4,6-dehydratase